MLGSAMIGAGLQLDAIFYVLAGLGLLGVVLTLLVPMARAQIVQPSANGTAGPSPVASASNAA